MTEREFLIQRGLLVPHPDLECQIYDDVYGPSFSQPWHAGDPGSRLDAAGRFWANVDLAESCPPNVTEWPSAAAWFLQTNPSRQSSGLSRPNRLSPRDVCAP